MSIPVIAAGKSEWRVPWFDGRASFRDEWPSIAEKINHVFDHDKFANGTMTAELEAAVGRYTGARYAIGVNSGADALYLILRAADIGEGDEVIVPAFAPGSAVTSVRQARATPVFADTEPDSHTLSPDAVRAALSARTRAVLPVHVFGRLVDMVAVRRIAVEAGVLVVEDGTQAMGARHRGVHAGLFGGAGALSFAGGNTLGALGSAGMVITGDAELARRCVMLRHHGRTGELGGQAADVSSASAMTGVNSKMDEIQAAVLLTRLSAVDSALARRRAVAARYTEGLARITGVDLPVARETWPTYVVATDRRDALANHLARAGIQTEIPCPVPPRRPPVAAATAARTLALPVYPDLGTSEIDYVCAEVARFFDGGRK